MFLFERFQLYGIIGAIVVLTAPGLWLIKRHDRTAFGRPTNVELKPAHHGNIASGLLFGADWSIAGMCPGPILVNIGEGKIYALVAFGECPGQRGTVRRALSSPATPFALPPPAVGPGER